MTLTTVLKKVQNVNPYGACTTRLQVADILLRPVHPSPNTHTYNADTLCPVHVLQPSRLKRMQSSCYMLAWVYANQSLTYTVDNNLLLFWSVLRTIDDLLQVCANTHSRICFLLHQLCSLCERGIYCPANRRVWHQPINTDCHNMKIVEQIYLHATNGLKVCFFNTVTGEFYELYWHSRLSNMPKKMYAMHTIMKLFTYKTIHVVVTVYTFFFN